MVCNSVRGRRSCSNGPVCLRSTSFESKEAYLGGLGIISRAGREFICPQRCRRFCSASAQDDRRVGGSMRKLGFSLCVLATLTAQALPLKADDAGSAMKGFGLVGSWSLDCSKDPAKELGSRATYTVPLSGAPTMELINHYKTGEIEDTLTRYDEIQSATRIGDYELQFVSVATKF